MPSQSDTFAQARLDLYDLQASQYRKSSTRSRYDRDEGLLTIPIMGPVGGAPVVVRVHAPVGYRVVEFEYARDGAPPVFPAQGNTNSGDFLLTSELSFPAPTESGQKLIFGAKGRYTYVQYGGLLGGYGPRGPESLYPIDRHPFPSLVDALGGMARAQTPFGSQGSFGSYNCSTIDARYLGSYGIVV